MSCASRGPVYSISIFVAVASVGACTCCVSTSTRPEEEYLTSVTYIRTQLTLPVSKESLAHQSNERFHVHAHFCRRQLDAKLLTHTRQRCVRVTNHLCTYANFSNQIYVALPTWAKILYSGCRMNCTNVRLAPGAGACLTNLRSLLR